MIKKQVIPGCTSKGKKKQADGSSTWLGHMLHCVTKECAERSIKLQHIVHPGLKARTMKGVEI